MGDCSVGSSGFVHPYTQYNRTCLFFSHTPPRNPREYMKKTGGEYRNRTCHCRSLQTHEKINRNNKKLKELDQNEWNATTTCIIQLKSAFFDVLASEAGLHWRFGELHNNYSVLNELQTHERINRNNKKLKDLEKIGWNKMHYSFKKSHDDHVTTFHIDPNRS